MADPDYNQIIKTATVTLLMGIILAWAGWVSLRVVEHCEISALNKDNISDLQKQIVVIFRKLDKLEEGE